MQMGEVLKEGLLEWRRLNSSLGKVVVGREQRLRIAMGATTALGGMNAIGVVSELKLVGGYAWSSMSLCGRDSRDERLGTERGRCGNLDEGRHEFDALGAYCQMTNKNKIL